MSAVPSMFSTKQHANFLKNSDPKQGISLCIPRVFNNIGWRRIKQHMIEANLGFVERVDVIPVAGGAYKRAFVHFAAGKWNMRDEIARETLEALQDGKRIKLVYDEPWYWLCGISGAERPAEAPKPRERKMKIQIADMIPKNAEYALDEQPDEEMRTGNDPILARAAAGNPGKAAVPQLERQFNMAEAMGAEVPEELR
tara:strand:+ start:3141 stop:3734 length:594 start_codon:yes stop_codon:yes gene_type:complete